MKLLNKLLWFSVFIINCLACSSSKKLAVDADYIVFSLKETECRGKCPVFSLEIYKSGKVLYEGIANVSKTGRYTKQISSEDMDELITEFNKAGFFNFQDEYISRITDLPSKYIGFTYKGRSKTIRDYHDAPQILSELEAKLEAIVGNEEGWMKMQ
jgi:Domain of unknown function (DUF6438)